MRSDTERLDWLEENEVASSDWLAANCPNLQLSKKNRKKDKKDLQCSI